VDECTSALYDASNCSARISFRTIRAMIMGIKDWIAFLSRIGTYS
jgi:hypothetical protein